MIICRYFIDWAQRSLASLSLSFIWLTYPRSSPIDVATCMIISSNLLNLLSMSYTIRSVSSTVCDLLPSLGELSTYSLPHRDELFSDSLSNISEPWSMPGLEWELILLCLRLVSTCMSLRISWVDSGLWLGRFRVSIIVILSLSKFSVAPLLSI